MTAKKAICIVLAIITLGSLITPVVSMLIPQHTEDEVIPTYTEPVNTAPVTESTTTVPEDTTPTEPSEPQESMPPEELPPEEDPSAPENNETEDPNDTPEDPSEDTPDKPEPSMPNGTEPENKPTGMEDPDIITDLNVVLYNNHANDFNLVDGREYIEDIVSYLRKYAPEGMYISAAAAMAYTEGGAGKKGVYYFTNNCFGIKAYSNWDGYVFARSDCKVYKDYDTAVAHGASDFFRAYSSMEESVRDYIKLISSNYYNAALDTSSPSEYLEYILSKGYGEKELHSTWLSLIKLYDLTQYDGERSEENVVQIKIEKTILEVAQ